MLIPWPPNYFNSWNGTVRLSITTSVPKSRTWALCPQTGDDETEVLIWVVYGLLVITTGHRYTGEIDNTDLP